MSEKELIEQFSLFGYEILKHGTHYSIFDRRLARRIVEVNSLKSLKDYAENIFVFPFMTETLQKTISKFEEMFSPSPVTIPESLPEETVTGEEKDSDPEPEQEQEQEETTAPVSPETEQKTEPEKKPDSPVLYTKTCIGCGKEFQTKHKQSMYCSPACYPSNKEKQQSQTTESPEKASAVQRPI